MIFGVFLLSLSLFSLVSQWVNATELGYLSLSSPKSQNISNVQSSAASDKSTTVIKQISEMTCLFFRELPVLYFMLASYFPTQRLIIDNGIFICDNYGNLEVGYVVRCKERFEISHDSFPLNVCYISFILWQLCNLSIPECYMSRSILNVFKNDWCDKPIVFPSTYFLGGFISARLMLKHLQFIIHTPKLNKFCQISFKSNRDIKPPPFH